VLTASRHGAAEVDAGMASPSPGHPAWHRDLCAARMRRL